jgi:hypothetical protein
VRGVKGKKRKPKRDNPAQSAKFIKAAKALGLDGGKAFEDAMGKVLKPKRGSS